MTSPNINNKIKIPSSDVNHLNDGPSKPSGRNRKINTLDWKNVKNKILRNSGKEYISQSKELVPAKHLQPRLVKML